MSFHLLKKVEDWLPLQQSYAYLHKSRFHCSQWDLLTGKLYTLMITATVSYKAIPHNICCSIMDLYKN